MCWLAISPPLKGEGTKSAEGCPRRWCKPAASQSVLLVAAEDPQCLFIVRRINKLGFKAARRSMREADRRRVPRRVQRKVQNYLTFGLK